MDLDLHPDHQPGRVDASHTYPDAGHGSLSLTAVPANAQTLRLPVRAGRWLQPDDTNEVVVNQLVTGTGVGDLLTLTGAAGEADLVRIVTDRHDDDARLAVLDRAPAAPRR
jgi:hypothetical protein